MPAFLEEVPEGPTLRTSAENVRDPSIPSTRFAVLLEHHELHGIGRRVFELGVYPFV